MPLSLKHTKVSDKSDGQDDSLLQPSHWNAEHNFMVPAKRLVGNSTDAEAAVEDISVGDGLELLDGELQVAGGITDAPVIVSVADEAFPDARVLTGVAPVTVDLATADQAKVSLADNGISLDKLDHGTQGDILYYADGGVPTRLAAGSKGMFLKSGTIEDEGPPVVAATNPSWAFSGAPHAVLRDSKANGTDGGGFTAGDWKIRTLTAKIYDTHNFVTLASNKFKLAAPVAPATATYVIEWSAPAYKVGRHQTRLWNDTDSIALGSGTPEFSQNDTYAQTRSVGVAYLSILADKDLEIHHRCAVSNAADGYGIACGFGVNEVYTIVKIWRIA